MTDEDARVATPKSVRNMISRMLGPRSNEARISCVRLECRCVVIVTKKPGLNAAGKPQRWVAASANTWEQARRQAFAAISAGRVPKIA